MIFFRDSKTENVSEEDNRETASREYIEEISYRLRDSLNSISGMSELVRKSIANDGDKKTILEYMNILDDSAKELQWILDDCFKRYIDVVDTEDETNAVEDDYSILNNLRVMIVEDNSVNKMIVRDMLSSHGAIISECDNGRDAVDKFISSITGTYDIILMDIKMPELNGYEATKEIRSSNHPQAKSIPIIAISAEAFAEDVQMALKSGMNAHISKPFNLDKLVTTIKNTKFKKVLAF